MATDAEHPHHSYSNNWSLSSDPQQPQEVSIPDLIDHSSISFGRFAAESLAWEKWSVFSHNKFEEELEKFKAPGLVAQKKAYFEEYYKKIRAMKKLQAEQQSDFCQEEQSPTTQAENINDISEEKGNNKHSDADQIIFSETGTVTYQDSPGEIRRDESFVTKKQCNIGDDSNFSLQIIELEHFAHKAAPKPASSIERCSKTTQQDNLASDSVKLRANKLKVHAALLRTEDNATLAGNKKRLGCRTKNDVVKTAEKPRSSSLHMNIPGKGDYLRKKTAAKAASNIKSDKVSSHKSFGEVLSSGDVMHRSVLKDKPTSSSTSMRGSLAKETLNYKGLANKSTLKEITSTAVVRNMDSEKTRIRSGFAKKSLELSSCPTIPKRGQSENQKPKSMSTNLAARDKSNQSIGNEFGSRNDVRVKQKQDINASVGRVPKDASSTRKSVQKTPNLKQEHKTVPWQSTDLTRPQRNLRHKMMPSWR